MNKQAGTGRDGQRRRSFTEAVAMFAPIVPLPGDAPRASATAEPDALEDDLPPATGPQPIPLPPRLRAAVLPDDALPAPVRTAPERPRDDLLPAQDPQPIAIPSYPPAPISPRSQAVSEPEAELTTEVPVRSQPMDDAAFRRSIAPPSLSDMPGQAAAAAAGHTRPGWRLAWPWAALLVLSAAGAAAVWVQRAPEPLMAEPHSVGPTAELTELAPAGAASPLDVASAPSPPTEVAVAEPTSPSSPWTLSEAIPQRIAEQPSVGQTAERAVSTPAEVASSAEAAPMLPSRADVAAEPALPSSLHTLSEPVPEPIPEVASAPSSPGGPDLAAPEPDAVAAEPPPVTPPAAVAEPAAASPAPQLPIPPLPVPPAPSLTPSNRRVVIYHRPASSAAAAEAGRLASKLRPLAAQVETRTADANFRLPTLRYFHAEDADAAQKLAAALRRSGAEWRVQPLLGQAALPPRSFQVWLPDR